MSLSTDNLTQSILCAMPGRIAVLDAQGHVVMVNDAWKEYNWRSSNVTDDFEWIGFHYSHLYPSVEGRNAAFVDQIKSGIQSVLSGDSYDYHMEYPYSTEEATGWFSITIRAVEHDQRLAVFTHSDIVKQKSGEGVIAGFAAPKVNFENADKSILATWSEELNHDMAKIVDDSLNEIFIFDAKSLRFIQVNRGGRLNIGYTLDELQSMTPLDIKPEYTYEKFQKIIEPLLNHEQEIVVFNTTHRRKDGTLYPTEIHLQLSTLLGQPVFVAIILDITESQRIKQELRDLNELLAQKVVQKTAALTEFKAKIENSKSSDLIGLWELDLSNPSKIYRSKEFKQLYEVDEELSELDSRYFLKYVHQEDRERIVNLTKDAIKHGDSTKFEYRITTTSGQLKFLMSAIHVVKNTEGKPTKLVGMVCDMTEQKKVDAKLVMALKKEQEVSMVKSRFVAMASHEFRTPLSTILSSTSLIGRYGLTEDQHKRDKHIKRIKSSVQNMTSILNDFLSLEKLESNKVENKEEEIDLNDFLSEIQEDTKLLLSEDQKLNVTHFGAPVVQTDSHLLKNIMLNLISNAVKYSPNNTDVEVISNSCDDGLEIQIKDHGIGIPEEEHDQMFSRFFRASNVASINGTGLGLTIVKRYLDLLGGDISFDSQKDKGTTFKVCIPMNPLLT